MRQVQEIQPGDYEGAGGDRASTTQGILEDPDGVVRIYGGGFIASCYGYSKTHISGSYPCGEEEHHIEWDCWRFDELRWSHRAALMFLQGASMQRLVMPYLLLKAHPTLPYDPRLGAYQVVMAEVQVAPDPPLDHPTMFRLLAPDVINLPHYGA